MLHMVDYKCDCGHTLVDEWKHRSLEKLIVCICGQTMKEMIQSLAPFHYDLTTGAKDTD